MERSVFEFESSLGDAVPFKRLHMGDAFELDNIGERYIKTGERSYTRVGDHNKHKARYAVRSINTSVRPIMYHVKFD